MPALTDLYVKNLKPQATRTDHRDTLIKGLTLRCTPNGVKSFSLVHGRSRSRITLGAYPAISVGQARAKAKEILAEITLGTHKPKSLTFQDAFDLYRRHKLPLNRASTAKESIRLLEKVQRRFGRASLGELSTPDLAAFLDRTTEKAHVFTALQTFFNWSVRRGYLETSPLARLRKGRSPARDRALSPPELRSVLLTSDQLGRYGQLIRFLIYTGQRLGQAHALTEAHIDRDKMTLSWPGSEMKVATAGGHSIPYGPLTAELIGKPSNLCTSGEMYISPIPFTKTERYHARFVKAAGVEHFTRHDLRRSFATIHASLGTPQHIVERLLAHSTPGGSAIHLVYNKFQFLDEMRQACEKYEAYLSSLIAGNGAGV